MFTGKQRRLLTALRATAGQVVPYQALAAQVWPDAEYNAALQHCMRVTAAAVNEALRDDGEPGRILAERGIGYAWVGRGGVRDDV
jgi:DNA-binding response OmpR family regulator